MRYLIQFADKTTKHLAEEEGKKAAISFAAGRPIVIRGAVFANHLISAVRPVNKDWYPKDYVEQDQRVEQAEIQRLSASEQKQISDAKYLGFEDKKLLTETKTNWKKV